MHATGQTRTHAWSTTSMQGSAITKVILLASLSRDAEARHGPEVCLWSCPDIIPGQMTRGNAQDTAQCMTHRFNEGLEDRGRQRCGRNHGLLPSPLLFPHMEGRRAVPHGRGSSTHKKTPTCYGRGRHTYAAAPFPRKDVSALCRAGLLARGISLLSAPSQGRTPQWFLQISFRSQLRGSDGFAPSSLVTDSDCDQPYQRHMQFCMLAYGRASRFVKDISVREKNLFNLSVTLL